MTQQLTRAVPNEQSHIVLEFDGPEYRLFDAMILYREKAWRQLAYPQHLKNFTLTPSAICWHEAGSVDADYLHRRSAPLDQARLERQVLRVGYKNQAPTPQHQSHHEYGVYLARFSAQPFRIGESIGGGVADMGYGRDLSLEELLLWPQWKHFFELAGCAWAIPLLESLSGEPERLLDLLVSEACRRNGA